ncbi:MAG TPA: hydrogenase iron-sulfur subunit [Candidatus Krumholzibacteria bacterium]
MLNQSAAAPIESKPADWKPTIVAVVCNWCTYAGADRAGTTRLTYPASVRMMRVPCTGRMSPLFVLRAFEQGADGVLLSGCHPGDCHYVQGNLFARRRFTAYRALLDFIGLDPRRFHVSWVSAAEGGKWQSVVKEVTAAVTDAGPLTDWGKTNGHAPVEIPAPPAPPRKPVAADEAAAISKHLRELAATLLQDKGVSMVLGYRPGGLPGQMVPAFVTRPEDAALLGWSERCHTNLAVYLAGAQHVTGKIAVVVKQCDARSVAGLLQETKIKREDVTLIGVSCAGVEVNDQLALKCYACDGDAAAICDYTVTADGVKPGAAASGAKRAVAADPRDAQIEYLEKLPQPERWAFWQEQFNACIRCYGCRAVCPSCYCDSCITEKSQPQWIPASIDGPGNTSWNFIRAYHQAGRCAGCDECARVCPSRLRLDLLNRRVAMEMEQRFHYHAGERIDGAPPLAAFQPDDPQEFIY